MNRNRIKNRRGKARLIQHPSQTKPDAIKTRILCQLVSAVKGEVNVYGSRSDPDAVIFMGTTQEQDYIQSLANYHIPRFWQLVDVLYKAYIEEHNLCKGEAVHNNLQSEQ